MACGGGPSTGRPDHQEEEEEEEEEMEDGNGFPILGPGALIGRHLADLLDPLDPLDPLGRPKQSQKKGEKRNWKMAS